MLPIKNILVPTDFSEPSGEGFRQACALAEHFGAVLFVVHVNEPVPTIPAGHGAVVFDVADYQNEMEQYAKTRMQEIVSAAEYSSITMTPLMRRGKVAEEITAAAEDHDVDMIVMATHGYSGWKKLLLGSVTEKVVRMASVPVLTINAPSETA
ncbi:MAG: universal stress protein [Desulfobacterales bacterium]|jgi:nucleotide-binding universal stress UspA family protein